MTDTRDAFEEHLTRNVSGLCTYQTAISQHPNGDYVSKFSQARWVDWQAATAAERERIVAALKVPLTAHQNLPIAVDTSDNIKQIAAFGVSLLVVIDAIAKGKA